MAKNANISHFHYHFGHFFDPLQASKHYKNISVKEEVLRIDLVGNM